MKSHEKPRREKLTKNGRGKKANEKGVQSNRLRPYKGVGERQVWEVWEVWQNSGKKASRDPEHFAPDCLIRQCPR